MKRLVVNDEKVSMITSAFFTLKHQDEARCYEIHSTAGFGKKDLVLGVNWSACGTRTPEETKAFANHLMRAAEFVSYFNSLNLMVEYRDEPLYESKEDYMEAMQDVGEKVRDYGAEDLANWLCADAREVEA